jgi:DNA-binding CsgD family transcriptional regulator
MKARRSALTRVDGRSYKQVASDLGIGNDTVRTDVRSLYRKLQVHTVAEAVTRALRLAGARTAAVATSA